MNQSRTDENDPNEIASVTRDRCNVLPLESFPSAFFRDLYTVGDADRLNGYTETSIRRYK
jgi:hypothetical protein